MDDNTTKEDEDDFEPLEDNTSENGDEITDLLPVPHAEGMQATSACD